MTGNIHKVYFIGIGGIGMSALARYFLRKGFSVAGYDRVSTPLTIRLESEGMKIHYEDNPAMIPPGFTESENTLVVYTPAIPSGHKELNYFRDHDIKVQKRSEVLGGIVKSGIGIAIAGTHAKTTISGMVAHILHESGMGCNAFLGGISVNYDSNYLINPDSELYVTEADEFDRSFLTLFPRIALITAIDADHLDIYGDHRSLLHSFETFASQVQPGGTLIIKRNTGLKIPENARTWEYSIEGPADYHAFNIRREGLFYRFSIHTPSGEFHDIKTGILGRINVENSVAAFAVAMEAGVQPDGIIRAIGSYRGIKRRFEVIFQNSRMVYIDDYAHHPEELKAIISSVREIFHDKKISGIFQPHLFSRTRDFSSGFAESLSLLDDVVLLPIYPAREEPIEGVSSDMILKSLTNKGKRILCPLDEIPDIAGQLQPEVLLTMGAGDIDKMTGLIKRKLEKTGI